MLKRLRHDFFIFLITIFVAQNQLNMCKISKDTILKANRKTIQSPLRLFTDAPVTTDRFTVSTKYGGTTYSQEITIEELRHNYEASLKKVCKVNA